MNDGISLIELILNASFAVQLVMLILFILSIISWIIIVQRWLVLSSARKGVFGFEQRFWSGMDLSQLYKEGSQMQQEDIQVVGMENIFRAGFKEFMRLRQQGSVDGEAIMEGAQRAMRVAYSREEEKLEKNLPFLATVGSVSPYVGLFGTVIGIMNAFLGLAAQAQATLQVVAAEAAAARTELELVQSATAIIQQAVQQVWNRPPSARNGMRAILQIRMLPTGELLDVRITETSGDPAFDRASENAIYSAAPFIELADLPINIFNTNFRTLSLIFQPEDLLN
ncbi:MAG: MotA/TolQ/ExbB proton channel family protein [Pseudohongiellaceae bacterium]